MAWRTIDGVALDPLGQFNELETLVRGVLAPAYLLDFLRFFVLFEDDGTLVKKIAHELAEKLRKSASSVDWAVREGVRFNLRLMVKGILRKYKYPPTKREEAIQLGCWSRRRV
jgi:hypothetical protein